MMRAVRVHPRRKPPATMLPDLPDLTALAEELGTQAPALLDLTIQAADKSWIRVREALTVAAAWQDLLAHGIAAWALGRRLIWFEFRDHAEPHASVFQVLLRIPSERDLRLHLQVYVPQEGGHRRMVHEITRKIERNEIG